MNDEDNLNKAYEYLGLVNDPIKKLFSVCWRRVNITFAERHLIEEILKETDYQSVRKGFMEAVANGVEKISYIRTVAKSEYGKNAIKENIKVHEKLKSEDKKETVFYNPTIHGPLIAMVDKFDEKKE